MILVDSSVWIDFFQGRSTLQTEFLRGGLGAEPFATGDLILAEVLRGFRHDRDYHAATRAFRGLSTYELVGKERAVRAAQHYRALRRRGATVRSTIGMLIGSFCIETGLPLLYSDRDFDPMVEHLGLKPAVRPQ